MPRMSEQARLKARGPHTLPLPPLPRRPGWLDGKGDTDTRNTWGHEVYDTWRKGKRPKPLPMPDGEVVQGPAWRERMTPATAPDYPTRWVWKHGTYEEVPVRIRQHVYAWDHDTGKWVRCKSPRAIAKYAKQA